jgi:hypothetical protein
VSECTCPVIQTESGPPARGFRQRCPVHGGQTRADFRRSTAERALLFRGLRTPASVLGWFKGKKKDES